MTGVGGERVVEFYIFHILYISVSLKVIIINFTILEYYLILISTIIIIGE